MENQLQNGNRVWEDLLSELFRLNYEQQSRITCLLYTSDAADEL